MKHLFFIFGVALYLCTLSSCPSVVISPPCKRDYSFTIPVSLSPALDTFHIGDTIHIDIEFPEKMVDINSGNTIDMVTFPFNSEILFTKIDENPSRSAGIMVEYTPKKGNLNILPLTGGGKAVQIEYENEMGIFSFSCDITLQEKGVFAIGFESFFLDEFSGNLEIECKTKSVDISYPLSLDSENSNYNYYLIQQSPDPNISKITKEIFDKYGEYAFVVTD